jgi:hypothetical protein
LQLVSEWQTLLETSESVCVDLTQWTNRASLDVIGAMSFGHDFKCGRSPEAQAILEGRRKNANIGLKKAGFVTPIVFRAFSFLPKLSMAVGRTQNATKLIALQLANNIAEDKEMLADFTFTEKRDLFNILQRLNKGASREALAEQVRQTLF